MKVKVITETEDRIFELSFNEGVELLEHESSTDIKATFYYESGLYVAFITYHPPVEHDDDIS